MDGRGKKTEGAGEKRWNTGNAGGRGLEERESLNRTSGEVKRAVFRGSEENRQTNKC